MFQLEKNSLIDALEALNNCPNQNSIWETACKLSESWGVAALNVGEVNAQAHSLNWVRSSMGKDWLDTYFAESYFECDPLIKLFGQKTSQLSILCGNSLGIENLAKETALNHGLHDAGYSLLVGTKFANSTNLDGQMVTFCFDRMGQAQENVTQEGIATASALLATFVSGPTLPTDLGFCDSRQPFLSNREREVLSLLATGQKTARISENLGIAEVTVNKHFANARVKLGAKTREHALFLAMAHKMISL